MHICFVCREYIPSLRGGGIASYIKETAHGLCAAGHRVTVVCASDDTREASSYKDGKVDVIRLKGGDFLIPQVEQPSLLKKFRTFYRFYSYRKRILQCLLQLKDVDIVEVPEYGAEGYYLKKLPIPVVTRLHTPMLLDHYNFSMQKAGIHNWQYYWQGKKELNLIAKSKYITSCSSSLKEWATQYTSVADKQIKVIYNPIQTKLWSQYQRKGTHHEIKRILFAGTICDWKGCGDLAEACRLLHEQTRIRFELHLIGKTGKYATELQEQYKQYEWFHLIGKVPREELMRHYTTADVICFPSWWENMPMVCIEAMLCGGIVLGSRSGGMSEIIEEGKSGFLIEPHNPRQLADKIEQAFALPETEKTKISMNAKQRIQKAFSLDVITKQLIAYYEEVIEDYRRK